VKIFIAQIRDHLLKNSQHGKEFTPKNMTEKIALEITAAHCD
jgi:hypothetical protein